MLCGRGSGGWGMRCEWVSLDSGWIVVVLWRDTGWHSGACYRGSVVSWWSDSLRSHSGRPTQSLRFWLPIRSSLLRPPPFPPSPFALFHPPSPSAPLLAPLRAFTTRSPSPTMGSTRMFDLYLPVSRDMVSPPSTPLTPGQKTARSHPPTSPTVSNNSPCTKHRPTSQKSPTTSSKPTTLKGSIRPTDRP